MKKLALLLTLVAGFAYAGDARLDELCNNRDIKDVAVCKQVIAEQLDVAYMWGEENAHLYKRGKLLKQKEFLQSEPMMNLCKQAPNKERCEKFRTYLVDEFNAGIGLY